MGPGQRAGTNSRWLVRIISCQSTCSTFIVEPLIPPGIDRCQESTTMLQRDHGNSNISAEKGGIRPLVKVKVSALVLCALHIRWALNITVRACGVSGDAEKPAPGWRLAKGPGGGGYGALQQGPVPSLTLLAPLTSGYRKTSNKFVSTLRHRCAHPKTFRRTLSQHRYSLLPQFPREAPADA